MDPLGGKIAIKIQLYATRPDETTSHQIRSYKKQSPAMLGFVMKRALRLELITHTQRPVGELGLFFVGGTTQCVGFLGEIDQPHLRLKERIF